MACIAFPPLREGELLSLHYVELVPWAWTSATFYNRMMLPRCRRAAALAPYKILRAATAKTVPKLLRGDCERLRVQSLCTLAEEDHQLLAMTGLYQRAGLVMELSVSYGVMHLSDDWVLSFLSGAS